MLLIGDVGGTKTLLALYREGSLIPVLKERYASADYPDLVSMVREFLQAGAPVITAASFGVAGPVVEGRASLTNLNWIIEVGQLQEALQIPDVHVLNDLEALANAVPHLKAEDYYILNEGQMAQTQGIAVIAPGTGLGEAFLIWDADRSCYRVRPSEGGHAHFAPRNQKEIEVLSYLLRCFKNVGVEQVCSGIGIAILHQALCYIYGQEQPEQIKNAEDPNPLIVDLAIAGTDPICVETIKMVVEILGSEAYNLVLKTFASGGLYIGGGIPPRILPFFTEENRFMKAFCGGRFKELLSKMPVRVITNPEATLVGALAAINS